MQESQSLNLRTNTLRIALESTEEYVGFVRIEEKSTLADVREVARRDLDDIPRTFSFVMNDGIPISLRQEKRIYAASMLPCVLVRSRHRLEKVSIHSQEYGETTGPFTSYVAQNTTFGDLVRSAADFWCTDPKRVMLQDTEGITFPLNALVHQFLSDKYKLYLVNRVMSAGEKKTSISALPRSISSNNNKNKETELWRIFTYYCAAGDSFDMTHLHKRQFVELLRHCNLINRRTGLSAAQATIVYTRMARKHKLGFPEFMLAIRNISRRINNHSNKDAAAAADDDDTNFKFVLDKHILRFARRWDNEKRQRCKIQLQSLPVMNVFLRFAVPLHDIFRFYANSSIDNTMTYASYLNFCHDFGMANMHAGTRHEFVESFLASCESSGLPFVFDTDGKSFSIVEFDKTLMKKEDEEIVSKLRLTFNRFLQAVGRFALATFCDVYPSKPPEDLVTCMLCEIGRSLQRSNVMKIISRRRNRVTTNPATLMRGVKQFQIEVLKLYRESDEGGTTKFTNGISNKSLTQELNNDVEDGDDESSTFTIHSARLTSPRSTSPPRKISTPIRTPIKNTTNSDDTENEEKVRNSPVGTTKQDIVSLQLFIALNGFRNDISGEMDEQTVLNLKKLLTQSTHVEAMLEQSGGSLSLESGLLDALTIRALQRHLNRELQERSKLMGIRATQTEEDGRWTLNLAETLREYLATHNQISSGKSNLTTSTSKKKRSREKKKEHEFDTEDINEEEENENEEKREMNVAFATSYLSENISFVKHGRRGRPKPRAFWLDHGEMEGMYIRWCEVSQRRTRKSKRCVNLVDIVDIRTGRRTNVFSRSKGGNIDCSFSIITKTRSVDLEAESTSTRDRWIHALRVVLRSLGIKLSRSL